MTESTTPPESGKLTTLVDQLKKLASLYIDNARLTLAEKATVLFSALAISLIALVLALGFFVFLIMGIANFLESFVPVYVSYLIVAGILAVAIVCVFVFKVQLIFNPVARFVTKLMVNPPKK